MTQFTVAGWPEEISIQIAAVLLEVSQQTVINLVRSTPPRLCVDDPDAPPRAWKLKKTDVLTLADERKRDELRKHAPKRMPLSSEVRILETLKQLDPEQLETLRGLL